VRGDIRAARLVVDEGAQFDGRVVDDGRQSCPATNRRRKECNAMEPNHTEQDRSDDGAPAGIAVVAFFFLGYWLDAQ